MFTQSYTCVVIFILSVLLRCTSNAFLSGLPGPFLAQFSSLYRILLVCTGQGPVNVQNLHQTYGPLIRTGPNHVYVCDQAAICIIYGEKGQFRKANFYDVFTPSYENYSLETVFSTQNPETHRRLSRAIAPRLSANSVRTVEACVENRIAELVQIMSDMQGQAFDIARWCEYWAFDISSAIVLGEPLIFMKQKTDVERIIEGLRNGFRYGAVVGQIPHWHPWLIGNERLLKFLRAYTNFPDPVFELLDLTAKSLKDWDRRAAALDDLSVLNWLQLDQRTSHDPLSYIDTVNSLFNLIIAGNGTTSAALIAILCYLIEYSAVQSNLFQEIAIHKAAGSVSSPVKYAETLQMPYLQAITKESMRLCPSLGLPLERLVPRSGIVLCDRFLPQGTNVSMCASALHHLHSVFGEDANTFRPERWIEADAQALERMKRCYFAVSLPFPHILLALYFEVTHVIRKGEAWMLRKGPGDDAAGKCVVEVARRFELCKMTMVGTEAAEKAEQWGFKAFWLPEHTGAVGMINLRVGGGI